MRGIEIIDSGYVLSGWAGGGISPGDADVRYYGSLPTLSPTATADINRVYFPKAGTVTRVDLTFIVTPTQASSEQSTAYIRLNNTGDTVISASVDLQNLTNHVTGNPALAVVAGDYMELKVVFATWATNPTAVYLASAQVYVTVP